MNTRDIVYAFNHTKIREKQCFTEANMAIRLQRSGYTSVAPVVPYYGTIQLCGSSKALSKINAICDRMFLKNHMGYRNSSA